MYPRFDGTMPSLPSKQQTQRPLIASELKLKQAEEERRFAAFRDDFMSYLREYSSPLLNQTQESRPSSPVSPVEPVPFSHVTTSNSVVKNPSIIKQPPLLTSSTISPPIAPRTPQNSPEPPDPPDFSQANMISTPKAATKMIGTSLQSKHTSRSSTKNLPRRYSCEEIYERMETGLCVFCDELDTPDHHLKHKRSRVVMIECVDGVAVKEIVADDNMSLKQADPTLEKRALVGTENVSSRASSNGNITSGSIAEADLIPPFRSDLETPKNKKTTSETMKVTLVNAAAEKAYNLESDEDNRNKEVTDTQFPQQRSGHVTESLSLTQVDSILEKETIFPNASFQRACASQSQGQEKQRKDHKSWKFKYKLEFPLRILLQAEQYTPTENRTIQYKMRMMRESKNLPVHSYMKSYKKHKLRAVVTWEASHYQLTNYITIGNKLHVAADDVIFLTPYTDEAKAMELLNKIRGETANDTVSVVRYGFGECLLESSEELLLKKGTVGFISEAEDNSKSDQTLLFSLDITSWTAILCGLSWEESLGSYKELKPFVEKISRDPFQAECKLLILIYSAHRAYTMDELAGLTFSGDCVKEDCTENEALFKYVRQDHACFNNDVWSETDMAREVPFRILMENFYGRRLPYYMVPVALEQVMNRATAVVRHIAIPRLWLWHCRKNKDEIIVLMLVENVSAKEQKIIGEIDILGRSIREMSSGSLKKNQRCMWGDLICTEAFSTGFMVIQILVLRQWENFILMLIMTSRSSAFWSDRHILVAEKNMTEISIATFVKECISVCRFLFGAYVMNLFAEQNRDCGLSVLPTQWKENSPDQDTWECCHGYWKWLADNATFGGEVGIFPSLYLAKVTKAVRKRVADRHCDDFVIFTGKSHLSSWKSQLGEQWKEHPPDKESLSFSSLRTRMV